MADTREVRVFHLGDVLSIITGVLLSPRYMDGVYELIRYLMGESPSVDRLNEAMVLCRVYLIDHYEMLGGLDTSDVEFENWRAWLTHQTGLYGEWIEVERPAAGDIVPLA
jgi:hypothetical protein